MQAWRDAGLEDGAPDIDCPSKSSPWFDPRRRRDRTLTPPLVPMPPHRHGALLHRDKERPAWTGVQPGKLSKPLTIPGAGLSRCALERKGHAQSGGLNCPHKYPPKMGITPRRRDWRRHCARRGGRAWRRPRQVPPAQSCKRPPPDVSLRRATSMYAREHQGQQASHSRRSGRGVRLDPLATIARVRLPNTMAIERCHRLAVHPATVSRSDAGRHPIQST